MSNVTNDMNAAFKSALRNIPSELRPVLSAYKLLWDALPSLASSDAFKRVALAGMTTLINEEVRKAGYISPSEVIRQAKKIKH